MRSLPAERAIRITHLRGPFDVLEPDWTPLVDPGAPYAPFRTHAWVSSWWKSRSTSAEPLLLVAERGGETIGILPAYRARPLLGGARIRLMGDGIVGSDGLGAIARARDLEAVSHAFAGWLRAFAADEIVLDDLDADDPLVRALRDAGSSAVTITPRYTCPFIRIDGAFADYARALPDGIFAQLRRRRTWLEKNAHLRFESFSKPDEIERGLKILFELHRRRWALDGGSQAIDSAAVERFHLEAGAALARLGWARLDLLYADGAPRAALYGFRHGNRYSFYQAGHDPGWRPRSVGTVLLAHVIEGCFRDRLDSFEFLRGDEPYKLKWSTDARATARVRLRGDGLVIRFTDEAERAWRSLRRGAKKILPPTAVRRIRAIERRLRGGTG